MIFVFGSNREGRHGKGAALEARLKHRAIYGQARGRQGNSYAIVTKELRAGHPKVTLAEIALEVGEFILYAIDNPEEEFQVTRIGCGLAGFREEDIKLLFSSNEHNCPSNCHLPKGWRE